MKSVLESAAAKPSERLHRAREHLFPGSYRRTSHQRQAYSSSPGIEKRYTHWSTKTETTIYRRYSGKAELVADAIEAIREEVVIPDTGSLRGDIDALIENAAQITLSPLGRQTVAMIISSAASNPEFAQIYWTKYLQPRRQAFAIVIGRAKERNEVQADLDPGLVFDTMSGIMLYALIFPPTSESWSGYVRRALGLLFQEAVG